MKFDKERVENVVGKVTNAVTIIFYFLPKHVLGSGCLKVVIVL